MDLLINSYNIIYLFNTSVYFIASFDIIYVFGLGTDILFFFVLILDNA